MKIHPMGAEFYPCRHTDRQTDRKKCPDTTDLIVSFHTLVNALDNWYTLVF